MFEVILIQEDKTIVKEYTSEILPAVGDMIGISGNQAFEVAVRILNIEAPKTITLLGQLRPAK